MNSLGRRRIALTILATVVTSGTGCSFWAVRGPSAAPSGGECTTSPAVPVVDGIFAAGLAGVGIAALADQQAPCRSVWPCFDFSGAAHEGGAALLGLAAVELAATTYGGIKVAACRERKAKLAIPASQLAPAPAYHPGSLPGRE